MAGVQGGGRENGSLERLSKMTKILQYLGDESGASAAEYALILALVAIAIIGGLTVLGTTINAVLSSGAAAM
jgi:pilus assembly protein Flp/PilA